MVVVEDRADAVAHGMVAATGVDVDGEDGVDDGEEKQVKLSLEKIAQTEGRTATAGTGSIVLLLGFGGWEVWLWQNCQIWLWT